MNLRMENALALADKCWTRANQTCPEFVENYFYLAEKLLMTKPVVTGDEFREYCAQNRLYRPKEMHPNVWMSGVRALRAVGWISPLAKVEPVKNHNHMPTVTLWRSEVYHGFVYGDDDV